MFGGAACHGSVQLTCEWFTFWYVLRANACFSQVVPLEQLGVVVVCVLSFVHAVLRRWCPWSSLACPWSNQPERGALLLCVL